MRGSLNAATAAKSTARPLGGSAESTVRRKLLAKAALGKLQIADPDGNWIDITDD